MLPPPERQYSTFEELIQEVQSHAHLHGYSVSKRRSTGSTRFWLKCDRGGIHQDRRTTNDRRPYTRLCNCPFEIYARITKASGGQWIMTVNNPIHNHPPAHKISSLPTAGRLPAEIRKNVRQLITAGTRPAAVLSAIQQNPNILANSRSIYNERTTMRRELLHGRTPVAALLDEIRHSDFQFDYCCDDTRAITRFFFAHPTSIKLTHNYPYVFLLDCTYKTNRFRMPLLHVVGVTSLNTSFSSCFVFLKEEKEDDYIWALQKMKSLLFADRMTPATMVTDRELALMTAIRTVFPETANILCVWHINKNVVSHCKQGFSADEWTNFMGDWNGVVKSNSMEYFEANWKEFEKKYQHHPSVINYLQTAWKPYKEQFVTAWTSRWLHFGNINTSRVEGNHSALKRWLQVSTMDLQQVHSRITQYVEHQGRELQIKIGDEKIRKWLDLDERFYDQVINKISRFALMKLHNLVCIGFEDIVATCLGQFTRTLGLPCPHQLRDRIAANGTLYLNDFHPQWHLNPPPAFPFPLLQSNQTAQGKAPAFDIIVVTNTVAEVYSTLGPHQQAATENILMELASQRFRAPNEPHIQRTRGRPLGAQNRSHSQPQSSTRREP